MERTSGSKMNPTSISTQDIHDAMDSYRRHSSQASSPDTISSKASNRDSGVSESSFISDRLSVSCDHLSINSDSHANPMPFTGDKLSTTEDPLGVQILSASDSVLNVGLGTHHVDGNSSSKLGNAYQWNETQNLEKEWEKLFLSSNYVQNMRTHALGGKLKFSKFRSIAWKLFLECLPEGKEEWAKTTKQHRREYDAFKQKCMIDPNTANDAKNLTIFNPLSQEEDSPWKQFFKDNELRATIMQDLDRLYPENPYFHTERVKEMMLNILFCHAKKNETLGYKQGMHELLAPIIHVLDSDSRIYRYLDGEMLAVAKCIVDPLYIEHDAFTLFCQLMDCTETWYHHHQLPTGSGHKQQFLGANATPFTDPVSAPPTAIVRKLNKIQDHLLRKHDSDLWLHLKELDIAPQVYGLRWIRLLFSREFPFPDVLVLWDALFAEGTHLDLVDYIYIGMLQSIRNKLMSGNYNTCVIHLMKFPRVHEDVFSYVKRALSLRGSKSKKARPNSRPPRPPAPHPPSSARSPMSDRVASQKLTQPDMTEGTPTQQGQITILKQKVTQPIRKPHAALASLSKRYAPFNEPKNLALPYRPSHGITDTPAKTSEELVQRNPESSRPFSSPEMRPRSDSNTSTGASALSPGRTMKALGSEIKTKLIRPRSRSRSDMMGELEKDHQRLQEKVMKLNTDVDSMQGMFLYCGRKMDSYIGLLQEELMKDNEADRDVVYLTLAGLKQVRDLLKGNLTTFRGSAGNADNDFIDIDNGIASRLQLPTSIMEAINNKPIPAQADYDHFQDEATKELKGENIRRDDICTNDDNMAEKQCKEESTEPNPNTACSSNETVGASKSEGKGDNPGTDNEGSNKAPLESYLENHLNRNFEAKVPDSIPVVTCAVGSADAVDERLRSSEHVSPEENFLTSNNALTFDHFSSDIPEAAGVSVTINNTQFLLDSQNSIDSYFSNMSLSSGPLDGFVFVDQDGKAQGSLTVSPTHPLDFGSDSDSDDGLV